jgi:hypothetical protein
MEILPRFLNPILSFLLTIVLGFLLSRRGQPYHGLLFNVHKLVALAAVILSFMAIYQLIKVLDISTLIMILLAILGLGVIALFVSGALMSAGKGEYQVMKLIHNISPFILVIAAGCIVYLLPEI